MKAFPAALLCIALAGCAADPKSIQAAYVSSMKYDGATCGQLQSEALEVEPRLAANAEAQSSRRTADTVGIILIGISPTMISPDNSREAEISRLKGEAVAIRKAADRINCPMPPPPDAIAGLS